MICAHGILGLMQVVAAAKHEDGYDIIVGGSSFGGFEAYMWVKEVCSPDSLSSLHFPTCHLAPQKC